MAKTVVERCYVLDISQWRRQGKLKPDSVCSGKLIWNYTHDYQAVMGYEVSTFWDRERPFIRLSFSWQDNETQEYHSENYRIPLTITQPRFGGIRWWFLCPRIINQRHCSKRVAKLYLPAGCLYFGCRRCYGLTYTSCQENHLHEDFWRKAAEGTDYNWRRMKKIVLPERTELLPAFK